MRIGAVYIVSLLRNMSRSGRVLDEKGCKRQKKCNRNRKKIYVRLGRFLFIKLANILFCDVIMLA